MTVMQAVLWGCLGGILPDVLRVIGVRHGDAPDYLKRGFFWLSLLLLVGVAALTAFLLAPSRIIDAIALGFSAPEILSSALAKKGPAERETHGPGGLEQKSGPWGSGPMTPGGPRPPDLEDQLRRTVDSINRTLEPLEKVRRWWGGDAS
jgi:hypothetical protein